MPHGIFCPSSRENSKSYPSFIEMHSGKRYPFQSIIWRAKMRIRRILRLDCSQIPGTDQTIITGSMWDCKTSISIASRRHPYLEVTNSKSIIKPRGHRYSRRRRYITQTPQPNIPTTNAPRPLSTPTYSHRPY